MSDSKDAIIEVPLMRATGGMFPLGVATGAKDKNGNIKAKQYADGEGTYSASYDGEVVEESAEITNPESKSEVSQYNIDKRVVHRLLPVFNRDNSANFQISNEEPEQDNIADVFIEDSNTKAKIAIQVTVSDEEAIDELKRTKSSSRSGNAYQLFSKAIKKRIKAKTELYPPIDRIKTVLALDGWPTVTKEILDSFKMKEKDFLEKARYCQIWFVGIIAEDIVRLY